jgi:hypothetical protein
LFKQLVKTKRIAETRTFGEFQEVKKVSQEGPKSTAEANILARLFKSTPVQKEIPGIMAGIKKLLRIDDAAAGKQKETGKKEPTKKKASKNEDDSMSESETATTKSKRGEQASRADAMDISGSDESGDEDLSQFDARLAPGSDSEADSESGENDDDDDDDDISDSISRSASPSFSGADSPPPKKAKATKGSAAPAQNTTFLPSLMAGGYWSGSEEATDEEDVKPQRKNRMGQQARRALWEKKFGAGANHVKQEEIAAKYGGRDNGWDTKRGATEGGRGRGGKRGGFGGGFGRSNRHDDSGAHAGGQRPSKPKGPPKDEGPLHPSWEAKRKAKEQAPAAFAGKKMTFD